MSGGAAREVAEDDGGEAAGGCSAGRLLRGRGAEGAEESVRAPQGAGRAGPGPAQGGAREEHGTGGGAQQRQGGGESVDEDVMLKGGNDDQGNNVGRRCAVVPVSSPCDTRRAFRPVISRITCERSLAIH